MLIFHTPGLFSSSALFKSRKSVRESASTEEMKSEEDLARLSSSQTINIESQHRSPASSMTSINDSLSPDLLFNIFKRLNCIETTLINRVCKQWFEIIDEHKSFWRTLHLPEDSLKKWDPSILELFNRKSESSLQDVDIGVGVREVQKAQIIDTRKKSKAHLKYLFLAFKSPIGLVGQDLLESFSALKSLRLLRWYNSSRVHLRRRSVKSDSQEDGSNTASPLRVLWYGADPALLQVNRDRFKNLVSLDSEATLTASEWRTFLEGPSRTLKHLSFGFRDRNYEDHSGVPTLDFPNLEILELISGGRFPQWLLIPDTAKLIALSEVSNLPSISELWTWNPTFYGSDIIDRFLKLEKLCSLSYRMADILRFLDERKANVEAGLQVDGVKMEMIKTLILPFSQSDPGLSDQRKQFLKNCGELVDVVEGNAQSRFIEVEY